MRSKLFFCLALILCNGLWCGHSAAGIIYPKAPEGGTNLVFKFASGIVQHDPPFFKVARIEDLSIGSPCRMYWAQVKDLASGKFLSVARAGGWQYPLLHGTNASGLANVFADEATGKATNCTGIFQSDMGRLQAVRFAEQLPQVQKQDYELRDIGMPWLHFTAIWLHAKTDDIIIPTADFFGQWEPDHPYSEKELIGVLKPLARQKPKEPRGMLD